MKLRTALAPVLTAVAAAGLLASSPAAQGTDAERFWPQWRGPDATGVSRHADPPVEWSETKNIRWKIEIPGRGSASPVVWGDRVFLSDGGARGRVADASARTARRCAAARRPPVRRAGHRSPRRARSSGSGRRAKRRRTRRRTRTTARGRRARPSPTASDVFAFFESRGLLCLRHGRHARSGRRISATS